MPRSAEEAGAQAGRIQKVVRVPSGPNKGELHSSDANGYGILRNGYGQRVFFDDSALCAADFAILEKGLNVLYVLEAGPLARAASVWIPTRSDHHMEKEESDSSTRKETFLDDDQQN